VAQKLRPKSWLHAPLGRHLLTVHNLQWTVCTRTADSLWRAGQLLRCALQAHLLARSAGPCDLLHQGGQAAQLAAARLSTRSANWPAGKRAEIDPLASNLGLKVERAGVTKLRRRVWPARQQQQRPPARPKLTSSTSPLAFHSATLATLRRPISGGQSLGEQLKLARAKRWAARLARSGLVGPR